MKTFTVHPFLVNVGVTSDKAEFINWYNSDLGEDDSVLTLDFLKSVHGMAADFPKRKKKPRYAIYMDVKAPEGTIWHESLHMVHHVLEYVHQPIDYGSTELQAYLMEYIAAEVRKLL